LAHPRLVIDLTKIEHNARTVTRLCAEHGIAVTGVTKGTLGHPGVARAMLCGGVVSIGESRMENVQRLQAAGVEAPYMLLTIPPLSEVEAVVAAVDVSLNSELAVLAGLSDAARRIGRIHDVIVMVDLGDLREGVWPDDLIPFAREAEKLPGIRLVGIGSNLTCYGGVVPTKDNMTELARLAGAIERSLGRQLALVSGGNSSTLPLIAAGGMPQRIDHVRIGEAILLGRETVARTPWPETFQDAFLLRAEVVERKEKPSLPIGERSEDAFGRVPVFVDHGDVERAIVNIGREDVKVEGLTPLDPRVEVLGASSDYVILDVSAVRPGIRVGDELTFSLNYSALLAAMTSRYVEKCLYSSPAAGEPGA
jgi:predicted amino acid racemase